LDPESAQQAEGNYHLFFNILLESAGVPDVDDAQPAIKKSRKPNVSKKP